MVRGGSASFFLTSSTRRGVGDIFTRVLGSANMPPEKRALDHDHGRSSTYKRSRYDDGPRDWRAAHLDDPRGKFRREENRYRDSSSDRHRDQSRGSSQRAQRPSSSTPQRERSPPPSSSSGKREDNTLKSAFIASRSRQQPSTDDEKEEGE